MDFKDFNVGNFVFVIYILGFNKLIIICGGGGIFIFFLECDDKCKFDCGNFC